MKKLKATNGYNAENDGNVMLLMLQIRALENTIAMLRASGLVFSDELRAVLVARTELKEKLTNQIEFNSRVGGISW